MTIDTIRLGMPIAQAVRVEREHVRDDRWWLLSQCVTCDEKWYHLGGLLRIGCRARRAAERTIRQYYPRPESLMDAVTAVVAPPWPVVRDLAPAAPPMWPEAASPVSTANVDRAYGGYRSGPHAKPGSDDTAELPVLAAA